MKHGAIFIVDLLTVGILASFFYYWHKYAKKDARCPIFLLIIFWFLPTYFEKTQKFKISIRAVKKDY